jgi:hypothetical protein
MRINLRILALAVLLPLNAYADEVVVADGALSGNEVALHDGRVLRLLGIKAALPDAKAFLSAAVLGKSLVLQNEAVDRYGRLRAGAFVQGAPASLEDGLLREGLAFVYPEKDDEGLDASCAEEREARQNKRGFWAQERDTPTKDARSIEGTYGFVVGVVSKAERAKSKVYLSFGNEEHSDFIVAIAPKFLRPFKKQGLDLLALQGEKIRVRGWVISGNAPTINVVDFYQIALIK